MHATLPPREVVQPAPLEGRERGAPLHIQAERAGRRTPAIEGGVAEVLFHV